MAPGAGEAGHARGDGGRRAAVAKPSGVWLFFGRTAGTHVWEVPEVTSTGVAKRKKGSTCRGSVPRIT